MVLSNERLNEYSKRLEAGKEGHNSCLSALLNVEAEDLVTEVRNLRTGLAKLKERVYYGADTRVIYAELLDLLEGKFK